ncbi:MAG: hypothetical protein IJT83_16245 [Victivallales bacterium]|jgi:hypothetical protein|nr:hypothetical protein [Victivallales bacterium]MBR4221403.1 hypothetical protein [Victivallales bacterium]
MKVNHTTESIRFDKGISIAEYAQGEVGHSARERQEQSLLPGSTTVSEALANIFPEGQSVTGEIMSALVAGNSAFLRTPNGFNQVARETIRLLREKNTPAAQRAVRELDGLLADTELFEQYRAALLES